MNPEIFSIEIRPGMFVRFHGIPWDLTPAEAKRVSDVVLAMGVESGDTASQRDRAVEALAVAASALKPFADDQRRWYAEDPEYKGREFTVEELNAAIQAEEAARQTLQVHASGDET